MTDVPPQTPPSEVDPTEAIPAEALPTLTVPTMRLEATEPSSGIHIPPGSGTETTLRGEALTDAELAAISSGAANGVDIEQELRTMAGVVAVRIDDGLVQIALDPGLADAVAAEDLVTAVRRLDPSINAVEIAHRQHP